jgi:hypothetical protein
MAAEVVTPFDRGPEPKRGEKSHSRRRLEFIGRRMPKAHTSREKLDVALDYYRAVVADHRVNQIKAGIATEHLADRLIASADQLANTIRRNR